MGEVCLVESYRNPFQDWFWELPGGGGEGEAVFEASKRELEEETGITASNWQLLGKTRVYNGLSTEWQVNVLATNLVYGDFVQTEAETRNRKFVSLAELNRMISQGQICDNQSIAGIELYKLWLEQG